VMRCGWEVVVIQMAVVGEGPEVHGRGLVVEFDLLVLFAFVRSVGIEFFIARDRCATC
jgi:hypothetical protein